MNKDKEEGAEIVGTEQRPRLWKFIAIIAMVGVVALGTYQFVASKKVTGTVRSNDGANDIKAREGAWRFINGKDPMYDTEVSTLVLTADEPTLGPKLENPELRIRCQGGSPHAVGLDAKTVLVDIRGRPYATTEVTYRFDSSPPRTRRWWDDGHQTAWPQDDDASDFFLSLLNSRSFLIQVDEHPDAHPYIRFSLGGLREAWASTTQCGSVDAFEGRLKSTRAVELLQQGIRLASVDYGESLRSLTEAAQYGDYRAALFLHAFFNAGAFCYPQNSVKAKEWGTKTKSSLEAFQSELVSTGQSTAELEALARHRYFSDAMTFAQRRDVTGRCTGAPVDLEQFGKNFVWLAHRE